MIPSIELRRDRSFSDVLNVSFTYLKQHWKGLAKVIGFVAAPVLALSTALVLVSYGTMMGSISTLESNPEEFGQMVGVFGSIGFGVLLQLVGVFLAQVVAFAYMARYEQRAKAGEEGVVPSSEVFALAKQRFGGLLLLNVLMVVAFVVASPLLIIPCLGAIAFFFGAAYLGVTVSIAGPMLMHEQIGPVDAIKRALVLIKGAWWQTFGLLFLAGIIYNTLTTIFSIPAFIGMGMSMFAGIEGDDVGLGAQLFTIVTSALAGVGTALLYMIPLVVVAFQYYNLAEDEGRTGLRDRVARYAAGVSAPDEPTMPMPPADAALASETVAPEAAEAPTAPDRWAARADAGGGETPPTPPPAADRWAPKPPAAPSDEDREDRSRSDAP